VVAALLHGAASTVSESFLWVEMPRLDSVGSVRVVYHARRQTWIVGETSRNGESLWTKVSNIVLSIFICGNHR